MAIEDLLREQTWPARKVRCLSTLRLDRTTEPAPGWQASVSYDGSGGAYHVAIDKDPAKALVEALSCVAGVDVDVRPEQTTTTDGSIFE